MKRFFNFHHYLQFLRKQPKHVQSVYGFTFAGAVTLVVAAGILYYDYGFWHDRYNRNEVLTESKDRIEVVSPGAMFNALVKEAGDKVKSLDTAGEGMLESKIEYSRDEENSVESEGGLR